MSSHDSGNISTCFVLSKTLIFWQLSIVNAGELTRNILTVKSVTCNHSHSTMQNDHTDIIVQNLRMYQSDFKGIITFWCRDVFILLLLVKDEIVSYYYWKMTKKPFWVYFIVYWVKNLFTVGSIFSKSVRKNPPIPIQCNGLSVVATG